jgi:hypothetical protein
MEKQNKNPFFGPAFIIIISISLIGLLIAILFEIYLTPKIQTRQTKEATQFAEQTTTASWQTTQTSVAASTDPVLLAIMDALAPVTNGVGVAESVGFDPQSSCPHPLVILHYSGLPYENTQSLPKEWLPKSLSETELVAVLGPIREELLGAETYTANSGVGNMTLKRFQYQQEVTILDAHTCEYLDSGVVKGGEPPAFPVQIEVDSLGQLTIPWRPYGSPIQDEDIIAWFEETFIPNHCP